MQCPKLKHCIILWNISNCDTACVTSVFGESYEFYKTSQINKLAKKTVVGFHHTTFKLSPRNINKYFNVCSLSKEVLLSCN